MHVSKTFFEMVEEINTPLRAAWPAAASPERTPPQAGSTTEAPDGHAANVTASLEPSSNTVICDGVRRQGKGLA